MTKSKSKSKKVEKEGGGLSRNERKRRSKLPDGNVNRILPDDVRYLLPTRVFMKRYGNDIPKLYRFYDVANKDWIDYDSTVHPISSRIEESSLFRYARKHKDDPDPDVEENYDTGSSLSQSLHIALNKPTASGSSGSSNNSEWCKLENFIQTAFPETAECKLIKSYRDNKLRDDPPFNNRVF